MPDRPVAIGEVPEGNESPVSVAMGSVRRALAERLAIRLESVSGRVDWVRVSQEAAPFQAVASHELGLCLRAFATLHDGVAGARIAIHNARDWGEFELSEAVAEAGFGSRQAVTAFDLAPFAGSDATALLLMPQVSGGVGDGISLLASVLTKRKSGVVAFQNFDSAHPSVQSLLQDAMSRGEAQDYGGRRLWLRGFTYVLLTRGGATLRLGFATGGEPRRADLDVDINVTLQKPWGPAATQAIVTPVLDDIADRLGIKVKLQPAAMALAGKLSLDRGLRCARGELERMLGRALAAKIAAAPDKRLRAVTIGAKDGEFFVVRSRALATVR